MCTTCHSLYIIKPGSMIPDKCTKIRNNTGGKCNNPLFRTRANSTLRGRPFKVFPYCSITSSLREMLMRKGFEEQLEDWRNRDYSNPKNRSDVYDGALWSELRDVDGQPFTKQERSILVTINIDWFTPFSSISTEHNSVGGIYLTIESLPRSVRYLPGNIIFLGCIPGKHEPHTAEMNNYLKIIVDELLKLYIGDDFVTYNSKGTPLKFCVALLKIAADGPGSRKTSGFLSSTSFHMCIYCDHIFKHDDENKKGLDLSKWGPFPKRRLFKHKQYVEEWKACTNEKQRKKCEQKGGTRWSDLERLPYWNAVRQNPYDPFHVLLLNVCGRMVDIWKKIELLKDDSYTRMQTKIESIVLSPGFDSLGTSVGSKFGYMTGSRWLTWLLVCSPYALFNELPHEHYVCWMLFVDACRILLRPSLT
ncbi:hypothetical protein K501DRAFT_223337, partial [Backusella circina FSU 941]